MPDIESSEPLISHTSESNALKSLGNLFSLVEKSLNDTITKNIGWGWADVDTAIHIHDIVLSLRHMRHGFATSNANIEDTSASGDLTSESDERAAFTRLLDEVERNDKFLSGTIRSYLDDARDSLEYIKSLFQSSDPVP